MKTIRVNLNNPYFLKMSNSDNQNFVTCAICDDKIAIVPNGIIVFCKCMSLGVDCTTEYTIYSRTIPKEHPGYNEWFESKKDVILNLRSLVKQKSF